MADIEYFGGLPQVGIVPRAPHAGPLLRYVYEQEPGRARFSGDVSQADHLYPPRRPLGGEHHALAACSDYSGEPRFAYGPARLDDVRAVAERLADARDILRPPGA